MENLDPIIQMEMANRARGLYSGQLFREGGALVLKTGRSCDADNQSDCKYPQS